jgi:hypothetical protein
METTVVEKCETMPVEAYKINRWKYLVVTLVYRIILISVSVEIIYFILYKECLHNPDCNLVATTFFALLSLILLDAAGFPTSKFIPNLKFS